MTENLPDPTLNPRPPGVRSRRALRQRNQALLAQAGGMLVQGGYPTEIETGLPGAPRFRVTVEPSLTPGRMILHLEAAALAEIPVGACQAVMACMVAFTITERSPVLQWRLQPDGMSRPGTMWLLEVWTNLVLDGQTPGPDPWVVDADGEPIQALLERFLATVGALLPELQGVIGAVGGPGLEGAGGRWLS